DGTFRVWDTTAWGKGARWPGTGGRIHGLAFSPDGLLFVTAGADATVRVWDAATGREVRALRGHADTVQAVAWSPDRRTLCPARGGAAPPRRAPPAGPPPGRVPPPGRPPRRPPLSLVPTLGVGTAPGGRSASRPGRDGTRSVPDPGFPRRAWEPALPNPRTH